MKISERWTLLGFMNLVPGCGEEECDHRFFPVDMPDGSQLTVCLRHVPQTYKRLATLMVAGAIPMPVFAKNLREIDALLPPLPLPVQDFVLAMICRMIRDRTVQA